MSLTSACTAASPQNEYLNYSFICSAEVTQAICDYVFVCLFYACIGDYNCCLFSLNLMLYNVD